MGADPFYQAAGEPVGSGITVALAADPGHIVGPGDDVAFTATITNTSIRDDAWVNVLDAGALGDVATAGSCSLPKTILPSASYACSFTGFVTGDPGAAIPITVTASGWSNGSEISAEDTIEVVVEAGASGELLFVVEDAAALTAAETATRARLMDLDYSVTTRTATTSATADATGKTAVLLSSSVRLSAIGDKFTRVPEPVIVWKPRLYDVLGLTAARGSTRRVTAITINNPTHPLAAPFDSEVAILAPRDLVAVGTPAPAASVVASAAGRPTLFAYTTGDQLANGEAATGCRMAYPAFHTAAGNYTGAGWTILENAVSWAAEGCPISAIPPRALFVVPNESNLGEGDDAIRSRLQSLGFTVVPRSAAGATSGDAVGIDLVLVSSTVGSATVDTKFVNVPEPVIIWQPWLYDAIRMSNSNGSRRTVVALDVMPVDHPIADDFAGETTIVHTPSTVAVGTPAPGATVIAEAADTPALFVFSPGDLLADGQPAPGCRIAYPSFHTTPSAHTAVGWQLFDDTVAWAIGGCAAP